jgi:hypothetical protein
LSQPDMEREMVSPPASAYIPSFTIYHVLPDLPGWKMIQILQNCAVPGARDWKNITAGRRIMYWHPLWCHVLLVYHVCSEKVFRYSIALVVR